MSKISKDKRDRIILVAIFTVGVSAAIWFGLINIQRRVLTETRQQLETAQQNLNRGQATLGAAEAIEQQFADSAVKLKQSEETMASPTDMYSWLILTLNDFRLGYNVEIPQFSRETPSDVGFAKKFPYSAALFTIRGYAHYHDFGKFLADFENKFPYIRVQNIELDPSTETTPAGGAEKLTFKMDLLTLVRPIAP